MDALRIEKAHLVGNSFDGSIALRPATQHPDRVDKLVLDGQPLATPAQRRPRREEATVVFVVLNPRFTYAYGWLPDSWPSPLPIALISIHGTATATWLAMPRVTGLLRGRLYPDRR